MRIETESFNRVMEEEWMEILRGRREVKERESELSEREGEAGTDAEVEEGVDRPVDLIGLSFSGGGIRSATFNLGVIQALAELRLLRRFDYLSTVSGGGYIGSWLSSWMASHNQSGRTEAKRSPGSPEYRKIIKKISRLWTSRHNEVNESKSIVDIEMALAPDDENGRPYLATGLNEPYALRHLRSFTDYLKPRGGIFSLDAMTAFTTWLRNTMLNQLVLIAVAAALLMLPLWIASIIKGNGWDSVSIFGKNATLWSLASFCMAIVVGLININLMYKPGGRRSSLPWYSRSNMVVVLIVIPLIVGSLLLSIMLPSLYFLVDQEGGSFNFMKGTSSQFFFYLTRFFQTPGEIFSYPPRSPAGNMWLLFTACAVTFLAGSGLKAWSVYSERANRRESSVILYGLCFFIATAMGLLLLPPTAELLVSSAIQTVKAMNLEELIPVAVIANILTFGPPLILSEFSFGIFIYVGVMGREFDEHQREWWSRLVAMIFFTAIFWLGLFGIGLWGSLLVQYLIIDYLEVGMPSVLAWLGASGIGAMLGRSTVSGDPEAKGGVKSIEIAARITPYIFALGLCLLVAYLLNASLMMAVGERYDWLKSDSDLKVYYLKRVGEIHGVIDHLGGLFVLIFSGLFALGALLSWRLDINLFSFHNFYRNRLTRAYLAAGMDPNQRRRNKLPLTGMSDTDSPRLDMLPSRPYHILNTALNITSGKHLSWKERKAISFFFSKRYCGYFLPEEKSDEVKESGDRRYCRTENYTRGRDRLSLSLPMTISGAAASPNEGQHTSPPLAFLMAVFNLRLGWWMQNSVRMSYWQSRGPKFGLIYMIKELLAKVDEGSRFVYLSDGGHFENLGIYELVRRRCSFILACDAGADPKYEFEDLGNAIRKCYIDLGVRIDIDVSKIRPAHDGPHSGRSKRQSAIGKIYYPEGQPEGLLLYIKASMGPEEATDIEHYRAGHPDFPHDPTANQFYTETQFESYRKLGYSICHRVFRDAIGKLGMTNDIFGRFLEEQHAEEGI